MQLSISEEEKEAFDRDGFVVIPDVLSQVEIESVLARFEPLFSGEFSTGIQPDEWNWRTGISDESLTRQICNAWKADEVVSEIVLDERIGRANAFLRGWSGTRINQDNIIWKPPGCKALGFHQDESYQQWHVPGKMNTVWITLDDTSISGGTIEYVRGSHTWPLSPPISQFHAPDDPLEDMRRAAQFADEEPELVPIVAKAGTAVIHHGLTWHGSRGNTSDKPRRSVVSHCMPANSKFSDDKPSPIYSRYKLNASNEMEETFFPILWMESG